MMTEMRIITKRLEDTPFDRLRASAHGEPVEPRDLRVSSRLREKPCRCDRRTYAACATDEPLGCLLGLRPGPLRCTPPRGRARQGTPRSHPTAQACEGTPRCRGPENRARRLVVASC